MIWWLKCFCNSYKVNHMSQVLMFGYVSVETTRVIPEPIKFTHCTCLYYCKACEFAFQIAFQRFSQDQRFLHLFHFSTSSVWFGNRGWSGSCWKSSWKMISKWTEAFGNVQYVFLVIHKMFSIKKINLTV